MVIAYREEKGQVRKVVVSKGNHERHPVGELRPDNHFSETLLKGYHAQECDQGSRFRSIYTKDKIKRVHETAIQRYEQTGEEQ